jgi:1,2-diacylglycerol 3-beta-galactosyltransferase
MKRILILMSKTGGGHLASAEAIQAVFHQSYGDAFQVTIIDLLMDNFPWPLREVPKSYGWVANRTPWLWGTIWRTGKRPRMARRIMNSVARAASARVTAAISRHQPDLIVSVHPLVQEPTLLALRRLRLQIPYAIVVTDLASTHPLWYHPAARRCFVASESAYQAGLDAGMRPEQMRLYGLPVRPAFAVSSRPVADLRAELGMDPDLPAALLVGGGEGIGRVAEIAPAVAAALAAGGKPIGQIAVICGRNRRLLAGLQHETWPVPVQLRGFVGNMSDWMAASNCIVTKAGPGTIAESLIRGLPILLSGYIPGQEEANVPYVVDNKVGAYSEDPRVIANRVAHWFGAGQAELATMATNARRLGNPHSTHQIVAELAGLLQESTE